MARCTAITAFGSPGHFQSEKAVFRVTGSNLNVRHLDRLAMCISLSL